MYLLIGVRLSADKNYQIETLSDDIQERKEALTNPTTIRFSKPLTIKYRGEFIQQFDIRAIINGATRRIYMLDCYEAMVSEEKRGRPCSFGAARNLVFMA